jgi:hypothetical protein
MNRLGLIVSCAAAIAVFTAPVPAQMLKPIDFAKSADGVNGKDLQFGTVELKTITKDTVGMRRSPVSDKTAVLKGEMPELKKLELQTLDLSTLTKTNLPLKNFTAKRAAITDKVRSTKDLNDVRQARAPITKRQIRPFTPSGEEELKKQLNTLQ